MRHMLLAGLMAFLPALALAQSMTPEEIDALINAKLAELNGYQELLNNPDPIRARLALDIMMTSGDAELERMAMEYGLFSTDKSVQIATLEAFLKTGPVLELKLETSEGNMHYRYRDLVTRWGGSVLPSGDIYFRWQVGAWNSEKACFLYDRDDADCFISTTQTGVSVRTDVWTNLELNDSGELVGAISLADSGALKATIPIAQ